ncbi:acylphosphatase [Sphingomicrobium clamense]|uniref:acylphosphatase n=1 Tax=Sphingomicrobium clamense TaxID=2851013 RepID=A0ABS6V844_9SPHN|nr:acylphosphatase [Sphingomicrobium sp. B8]MBW0145726.1 acylphosphatase [Sphingomicrobium sp. B8]
MPEGQEKTARWLRIRGKVQGVGFRWWTERNARELDVNGWVLNAPDGSVEAHFEGKKANVERLIERVRGGPPTAQVKSVDVNEATVVDLAGFEIRH